MLCTIQNINRHLTTIYKKKIGSLMLNNINTLQMDKTNNLWIFRKRFSALLKRLRLPASTIDPGRLFQSHTIRIGKEYLYGFIHFAGLTYSLYGWFARVALHLVNSRRSSKLSLFMPKTILQHSTKERNNLRVSSVGHFSFLKRSSSSISPRLAFRCEALKTSQPQGCVLIAPSGL